MKPQKLYKVKVICVCVMRGKTMTQTPEKAIEYSVEDSRIMIIKQGGQGLLSFIPLEIFWKYKDNLVLNSIQNRKKIKVSIELI